MKYFYISLILIFIFLIIKSSKTLHEDFYRVKCYVDKIYKVESGEGYASFAEFHYKENEKIFFFEKNVSENTLNLNDSFLIYKNRKSGEIISEDNPILGTVYVFFYTYVEKYVFEILFFICLIPIIIGYFERIPKRNKTNLD